MQKNKIFTDEHWRIFGELCKVQCTKKEICQILNADLITIEILAKERFDCSFDELHEMLCAPGKASLRRYQFRLAKKSASMAIFLGRVYLGQRDESEDRRDSKFSTGILDRIKEIVISDEHTNSVHKAIPQHQGSSSEI